MPSQEFYREANRRRHKLLGMYLALQAWKRGVECIAIQRDQLLAYLDLRKMPNDRLRILKKDLSPFFKYNWDTMFASNGVYATLYLSRRPIPDSAKQGEMKDVDRVAAFRSSGLRSAILKIPAESRIVKILASMSHGLT